MIASQQTTDCIQPLSDESEFMKAFQEAIKDPALRKEIISVLEAAGLLPLFARQPA